MDDALIVRVAEHLSAQEVYTIATEFSTQSGLGATLYEGLTTTDPHEFLLFVVARAQQLKATDMLSAIIGTARPDLFEPVQDMESTTQPGATIHNYGAAFQGGSPQISGYGHVFGGQNVKVDIHVPPAPPPPPAFRVPYAESQVFGREAEMAELERLFAADKPVAVTTTGMGGMGKSFLAAAYAHRHKADYPGGIFWLNMEQAAGIAAQVAACGGPGGMNLPGWTGTDTQADAERVRAAWQTDDARLLIFDNCEEPALLTEWQPATGGSRVLITSRNAQWPTWSGVTTVPLQTLLPEPARALLCTPRAKAASIALDSLTADPAAAQICEALGYLPLALALAAAYLAGFPTLTLEKYRAKVEQESLNHRSLSGELKTLLPTGHEASIVATFALSYDQLLPLTPALPPFDGGREAEGRDRGSVNALALAMLHRAALLAPAPIPRSLMLRLANVEAEEFEEDGPEEEAIRQLCRVGLVSDEGEALTLHRLIAAFARSRAADAAGDTEAVEQALINEVYPINLAGYPQAGVPYLPHLRHVAESAARRADERAALLLTNFGYLLDMQGDYAAARPLYERALAIREEALGPTHPDTAQSLNNLAGLLSDMGDYTAARPLYEHVLAITEEALGPTHPDTAASINNLALLLYSIGDYTAARPLYERALAIREEALGSTHPDIATNLNNLAELLRVQGDYAAARPLYERALAIREEALGPTHPETARSLNNFAVFLEEGFGDYEASRKLKERALAIREQVLGPIHPDTAQSLSNLAELLRTQGDYAVARPLSERALAIREEALGPIHPDTATSLNNLAVLLEEGFGDYEASRKLKERALAINEETLGPTHPQTATSLNNLGMLLYRMDDYAAARRYIERALTIREQVLGPTHPQTAQSLHNLAMLFSQMGDFAAAYEHMARAVTIFEKALGPEHPNTQRVQGNLAGIEAEMREKGLML